MHHSFVLKRIISPALPETVLHRPSLVAALNKAVAITSEYKLILLCAPAGYGKTTLLADFAKHTEIPCCWYFLDAADTDKVSFLKLLLASIRQRFPQFGAALDPLLANAITADESAMLQCLNALIDALVGAIATEIPERFALLLCNYHEINQSQVINNLVNRLLRRLPPQCILILSSRAVPTLEFTPLLARREMLGLGSNDLRFTAQEIHNLAQLQGTDSLTQAEAAHLAQSFDGWITGILLGTRLGDHQFPHFNAHFNSAWESPTLCMDRQYPLAYLFNEVFTREPDAYAFLKEAVVLQQMTPSLCAALLDIPDAAARLTYLEQQGLFVTRYGDGPGKYYICHPILRELLYDELRLSVPTRFSMLHRRAAELFHAIRDDDQAIYHCLAVGAYDIAADLISGTCQQLLAQGHSATVAHWIDALPGETTIHHPRLLLARATIFLSAGEHARALPLLDAVLTAVKQDSDEAPVLLAETLIARSAVQFQRGDYLRTQELCQQALALLPVDEVTLRAEVHLRLGTCAGLLGSFTTCIAELQQALQLRGCDTETHQVARLHTALANAYGLVGHHILSEYHRLRAVHCWERLNDEWGKIDNLVGLGVTKQRQAAYVEAEHVLNKALAAARGATRYQRGEAYALVSLGDLYQDQNCYQQALSAFEDGLALAHRLKDCYLKNYTVCAMATTYLLIGDPQTALALISQIDQETTPGEITSGYGLVLRELTLGTILLQQRHYSEAHTHLTRAEESLHTSGLKREQLQAIVRTAACLLAEGDTPAMIRHIEKAVALSKQSGYELLTLIELRRTPELLHSLQTRPETIHLREFLREEADAAEPPYWPPTAAPITTTLDRPTLRVLALGEPTVFLNDTPITHWRMAHAMELCFFLLNAGQPVHKERIIDALWHDSDDQIDQTLRSTLYYLRKVLGTSCVISRTGAYTLDLTAVYGDNVWYDVAAFQNQYAAAQAALAVKDDTAAGAAFQEMTRLYRGDYVQSFYSDWCTSSRDKLRRAHLDAHHQLALMAWRADQLDESIFHWQHLLAVDNCLEEAHHGLMCCYMRQGKRGLALRQYQRCVESLQDDLATTPGKTIQQLYQRLTRTQEERGA